MYKFVTNHTYLFLLANGFYVNNIDPYIHNICISITFVSTYYILYVKKYRTAI